MENPESRPAAAELIDEVIDGHQQDMIRFPTLCGLSLAMRIYDALIRAGYMIEGFDPPTVCPCPFDCDGCHDGDGVCWRGNPELWEEEE
jgi:hypothetical protein